MKSKIITVGEVKNLLQQNKTVKVKTINDEYTKITDFVEKGLLDTILITLENDKKIKVTKDHLFFTNVGWLKCRNLEINKHCILNKDNKYYKVTKIKSIGKHRIVDITVEHPESCYFGNDMLNHNTGKSLLLASILANTQKMGGIAVLFENEFSADPTFCKAIGLDTDNVIYANLEYIEDMLSATEEILVEIRKTNIETPIVVGWDSVAGAKTRSDAESDYDKSGYNTDKAIILSQKIPKILPLLTRFNAALVYTQQLRAKLNVMGFSDPYTPASGGMSLGFYSSVIIRLYQIGKIKSPDNFIVGTKNRAKINKNRLGPPFREAEFEIYFDSGIDDAKSCLDKLIFYKFVKGTTWKQFTEDPKIEGLDIKYHKKGDDGWEKASGYYPNFQMATWREWMINEDFHKAINAKIAELSIMKYTGFMNNDQTTIVNEDDDLEEDIPQSIKKQALKEIIEE